MVQIGKIFKSVKKVVAKELPSANKLAQEVSDDAIKLFKDTASDMKGLYDNRLLSRQQSISDILSPTITDDIASDMLKNARNGIKYDADMSKLYGSLLDKTNTDYINRLTVSDIIKKTNNKELDDFIAKGSEKVKRFGKDVLKGLITGAAGYALGRKDTAE